MSGFVEIFFWIVPLLVARSTIGVIAQTPTPETEDTLFQENTLVQEVKNRNDAKTIPNSYIL